MGAISNHYGDVQNWVEKVIDSCETYNQARSARMLVLNFEKQMSRNKVNSSLIWSVSSSLSFELTLKRNELLKKQL
jgi:sulfur relay (sulfurtransferase) DsrC/TusE family protein